MKFVVTMQGMCAATAVVEADTPEEAEEKMFQLQRLPGFPWSCHDHKCEAAIALEDYQKSLEGHETRCEPVEFLSYWVPEQPDLGFGHGSAPGVSSGDQSLTEED